MSWRRTRIARSSSQGDIGFFNQVQTIEYSEADHLKRKRRLQASVSFQKPAQKGVGDLQQGDDESRPCIFTIGSPEGEGKNENSWSKKKQQPAEGFGVFLKACFLCKKKLPPDEKDVYMYQYHCLAAFCSPECREDQMALDGLDEEIAKDSPHIMFFGRPVKWFQPVKKLQRPREFYLGLNID